MENKSFLSIIRILLLPWALRLKKSEAEKTKLLVTDAKSPSLALVQDIYDGS